jgi:rhodanese-related sulfurtransferase
MKKIITFLLLIGFAVKLTANDELKHPDYIPEKWHTPYALYVSAKEAYTMKQEKGDEILLIDVRTRPEVKYVGIADTVDANIPIRTFDTDFNWSEKSNTFRTKNNEDFVPAINRLLAKRGKTKETTFLLMCQSGSRAPIAAQSLHDAGFKSVYTVWDGFEGIKAKEGEDKGKRVVNGWKNADLPWSYQLIKENMYFPPEMDKAN